MKGVDRMVLKVLGWYARFARDLPWRRTRDPYAIWVSEVMLQQTQVQTVIPYWERWMQTWPNLSALADAPVERVLRVWEGLGYYRRARNLHRAAGICVTRHQGRLPTDYQEILDLPGIGDYSAGAIASVAFNQPRPVVDGNVVRLLTRLEGIREPVKSKVVKRLWRLAEELVSEAARQEVLPLRPRWCASRRASYRDPSKVGWCSALNQGLMELGAVVCLPRHPNCNACPLSLVCVARQKGWQNHIPNAGKIQETRLQHRIILILQARSRVFMRLRPDWGVNGGFWEFPEMNATAGESETSINQALKELKLGQVNLLRSGLFKHSITRFRFRSHAFWLRLPAQSAVASMRGRWVSLDKLEELPLVAVHRQIVSRWGIGVAKKGSHD